MATITDAFMKEKLTTVRNYTVVILKKGPHYDHPDLQQVTWEHGRRNFALREDGWLSIVCPVSDGTDMAGIGIFNADPEKTRQLMDGDPGVRAGIFVYELHQGRSFPGDSLP